MDEKLKNQMANKLSHALQVREAWNEAMAKRKETGPAKNTGKANYQGTKSLKTDTHRIVESCTVTFKDGRVCNYKLHNIDTIYSDSPSRYAHIHGPLKWPNLVGAVKKAFKKKVNNPETDIVFQYHEEEKCRVIGGGRL